MEAKEAAARKAVEFVRDGMAIGLGTGSTAKFAIEAIGERIRCEGLRVSGIPTSGQSHKLAVEVGIPIVELTKLGTLDLTIDGADEVDPYLNLIKGGGGALLREKIVAAAGRQRIIICDASKVVPRLGVFPLPVVVAPFGWEATRQRLEAFGKPVTLRREDNGQPFVSDDGLYVLDMHLVKIEDPADLERRLKQIVGVVEVGLFVGLTDRVLMGYADGHVEELLSPCSS